MTIKQVYYRLIGMRKEFLKREVADRRNIFFMMKAQGVTINHMPLKYMWQVWHMPEVDGPMEQAIKYSKVRLVTPEEKKLLKERPPGWEKQILEIQRKVREDAE